MNVSLPPTGKGGLKTVICPGTNGRLKWPHHWPVESQACGFGGVIVEADENVELWMRQVFPEDDSSTYPARGYVKYVRTYVCTKYVRAIGRY